MRIHELEDDLDKERSLRMVAENNSRQLELFLETSKGSLDRERLRNTQLESRLASLDVELENAKVHAQQHPDQLQYKNLYNDVVHSLEKQKQQV